MNKMFRKEIKLAASPLSFFFILAAFLTFVPGYPILLGAFFTTLGIFYSFQTMRENNDITYSLLLPIRKGDIVKAKFAFTLFIELCSFLIMVLITIVRMTILKNEAVYTSNALMCANLTFLGFSLLIFGMFNFVFVAGFFKTAYYFAKPFISYCVIAMIMIVLAETLHHIPKLAALNSFGFDSLVMQTAVFIIGIVMFLLLTFSALKKSVASFERIDL